MLSLTLVAMCAVAVYAMTFLIDWLEEWSLLLSVLAVPSVITIFQFLI